MSNNPDAEDFPYLSEEDINLLHSIIVTAEADTTSYKHPIRAVFAAYYTVLAAHDINPNNDSLYLRFLLRMREGASKSDTLLGSFTKFLRRLGIQVVFDQEDDYSTSSTQTSSSRELRTTSISVPEARTEDAVPFPPSAANTHALITPLRRRESFTNLDDTIQSRRGSQREPRSVDRAPMQPRSVSVDLIGNDTKRVTRSNLGPRMRSALKHRREASEAVASTSSRLSRKAVVQIREDPSFYEIGRISDASFASENDRQTGKFEPDAQRPSRTDAEWETSSRKLRFHFLAAHACQYFWSWRRRANVLQKDRTTMLQEAVAFDERVLKKQAFEQWRASYLDRDIDQESKQFFESLEKRAGQARDLYLLTKAFTHWAQCASDETQRTSAARRHILRTRYFNAWCDVTVVNELKARQQGLSKFLTIWKKRNVLVSELQANAWDFRQVHLASNMYRNWFWSFADRKIPVYYSNRLIAKAFGKWKQITRSQRARGNWTEQFSKYELSRRVWNNCRDRLAKAQSSDSLAHSFRQRSLLLSFVQALRRELEYRPRERALKNDVEARGAQIALWQLHSRTCQAKEAHIISEIRTMKHAFLAWNERLRYQVMKRTIDDRILTQALYQWAIAERLKLAERVRVEDSKRKILQHWRHRLELLCGALGRAEHHFTTNRQNDAKREVLTKWSDRLQVIAANANAAASCQAGKLMHYALEKVTAAERHVDHLERVASDARFFSLGSAAVKRWQEATLSTRKTRRREAYSSFRREQKMKAARRILEKWRVATEEIQSFAVSAESAHQQQLLRLIRNLLQMWSSRTHALNVMAEQALATSHDCLLKTSLAVMSRRRDGIHALTSQADDVRSAAIEAQAAQCFQRMAWHVFQIRRHGDTAASFAERASRKHRRFMVRHWADKAIDRQKADFSQTVAMPESLLDEVEEEANTFDPGASLFSLPEARVQATPGYLRTPSRRAPRARAIGSKASGNTPATSQITPFWNRMREVYPASAPRTDRPNLGRSGRWRPSAIPESSPPA